MQTTDYDTALLMAKAHRDERVDPRVRGANPNATWDEAGQWERTKEIAAMTAALVALHKAGFEIVKRK